MSAIYRGGSVSRHTPVVIVGGGPAGLATAACLEEAGVDSVILDRGQAVGDSWAAHYDRLHLHTDRLRSNLPGFRLPEDYPRYPSRDQVVAYLQAYARHFDLQPHHGRTVQSVCKAPDGMWHITCAGTAPDDERWTADHVVVATGWNNVPYRPTWPGFEEFVRNRGGEAGKAVVHSSEFDNGERFRGQRVLVVGFGNSGGEIAIDLSEHGAHPTVSVRSPVNVVPKELFGVPLLAFGIGLKGIPPRLADLSSAPLIRWTIGDIRKLGFRKLPYGPMEQIARDNRIPLIDIGTVDLIKAGKLKVRPGVRSFTADGVVFDDEAGTTEAFDAVVLATGYTQQVHDFLQDAHPDDLDARGTPRHSGQASERSKGLWFCGFYVSPTGMLREIALESRRIAAGIASDLAHDPGGSVRGGGVSV